MAPAANGSTGPVTDNNVVFLAVAFCPEPPLLHPEALGTDGQDLGAALRAACSDALGRVLAVEPEAIVVLGAGPDDGAYGPGDAGDLLGYGVPVRVGFDGPPTIGAARLPLAHTLGAWLLDEAGFSGQRVGLSSGTTSPRLRTARADDRRSALLVMGDGSARRTEKSPGWFSPDAIIFDETVTAVLASGDGQALLDLDVTLGEQVLAAGLRSWQTAGEILAGVPMIGQVHYAQAPFGVFYVVASWVR